MLEILTPPLYHGVILGFESNHDATSIMIFSPHISHEVETKQTWSGFHRVSLPMPRIFATLQQVQAYFAVFES